MKPLGFYGNLPLAQTPIRASNTNNTRQTFTPCLEHHDFMPWCMQVRQNEFEIPYIVRQNPCTFAPCVCRPSSVWVRPALCRRNANTKVFPSARLENSIQATVLGRHEVCLNAVQTVSNQFQPNNQLCNFTTTNKTPTASRTMPEAGNFHAMMHTSKTELARDPVLCAAVSLWIRPLCVSTV